MYELNGEEVTLEFLQGKAQEYGMDIDSYLETMKKKGLVEKTNGSQTEDATAEPVNMASTLEDTSLDYFPYDDTKDKHNWLTLKDEKGDDIIDQEFFDQNDDEAAAQLQEKYPGFKFEATNNIPLGKFGRNEKGELKYIRPKKQAQGFNVVKVTAPNGEEKLVEFNIGALNVMGPKALGYESVDQAYNKAYGDLTSFINKNSTSETDKKYLEEYQNRSNEYRKFDQTVAPKIFDLVKIQDKFEAEDLFDPITKTTYVPTGKFGTNVQKIETTTNPYEKELNAKAKELGPDASKEQIQRAVRDDLIRKSKLKIRRDNTEAILDTKEGQNFARNQKYALAAKEFNKEYSAKIILREQLQNKLKVDSNANDVINLSEKFKDRDFEFDIKPGEEYVQLENGKKVPKNVFDNFQSKYKLVEENFKNLEELTSDVVSNLDAIEAGSDQLDLLRRNYNGWEEFGVDVTLGLVDLSMGYGYGSQKFARGLTGQDLSSDDILDENFLDWRRFSDKARNKYKKDVEFDDAFSSWSNFGSFAAQELANQIPIFTALALPGGMVAIGTNSFGEQYADMTEQDMLDPDNATSKASKWWSSLGYGASEVVFGSAPTYVLLRNAKRSLQNTAKNKLFDDGVRKYIKDNLVSKQYAVGVLGEPIGEGLTQFSQNAISGRPLLEGLDHAMFSGFMFGKTLATVPIMKGAYLSQFSDAKQKEQIRIFRQEQGELYKLNSRIRKGLDIAPDLTGKRSDLINENDQRIEELQELIELEVKKTDTKVKTLSNKAAKSYINLITRQEDIRIKAQEIAEDTDITSEVKTQRIQELEQEFSLIQDGINEFRKSKTYNSNWSLYKSDKKNKSEVEKLREQAEIELLEKDNIKDPSLEQINDRARIIYNTNQIKADIAKTTKRKTTSLRNTLVAHDTQDQTIEYLTEDTKAKIKAVELDENLTPEQKSEIKENLNNELKNNILEVKQGAHGFMMADVNGELQSVVNVENMAVDDRLETKTHELQHVVFASLIGTNDAAYTEMSNAILDWTRENNIQAFERINTFAERKANGTLKESEVVAVFMEEVAAGNIDLNKNKSFAGLIGYFLSKNTQEAGDIDIDLGGETDAIKFLVGLANKIKNDQLTLADISAVKKNEIIKSIRKGKVDTQFSKAQYSEMFTPEQLVEIIKSPSTSLTDRRTAEEVLVDQFDLLALKALKYDTRKGDIRREDVLAEARAFFPGILERFNPATSKFSTYVTSSIGPKQQQIYEATKRLARDAESLDKEGARQAQDDANIDNAIDGIEETNNKPPKTNVLNIGRVRSTNADVLKNTKVKEGDSFKQVLDLTNPNGNTGKNAFTIFQVPASKILDRDANGKAISANLTYAKKFVDGIPEQSEAGNIQNFFNDKQAVGDFIRILPKENVTEQDADVNKVGENIEVERDVYGNAIGLPNSVLNYFYEPKIVNGKRVRSKGKTSQVPVWKLKEKFIGRPNAELIAQVQRDMGITPRGELNLYNRTPIGQLLKGMAKTMAMQVTLSGAQRNLDIQGASPLSISRVTAAQSKLAFSKAFKMVDSFIDSSDNIELNFTPDEAASVDKVLSFHTDSKTYDFKDKDSVDDFWKDAEEILIPTLPKELVTSGFFFKSNRILRGNAKKQIDVDGVTMSIEDYYKQQRDIVFAKKDLKYGEAFTGAGANYKYGIKYGTYFGKTPKEIEQTNTKGRKIRGTKKDAVIMNVQQINEMHLSMHRQMWQRINESIRANPSKNAPIWGNFFAFVGNNAEHPHRMGAEFIGWTKKPKGKDGKLYEWEHAMPATRAYLYLLHTSLGGFNFDNAYDLIQQNYKLIALDNYDDKVKLKGAKRNTSMGEGWTMVDNWFDRYFDEIVGSIEGGIDPQGIQHIKGKSLGEELNINADGKPMFSKPGFNKGLTLSKATNNFRAYNKDTKSRGMSTFDFDETLIIDGENFVTATKDGEIVKIPSDKWPIDGPKYADEGYSFDFSDFVNVRGGKEGPLLQKMKNQIRKYGSNNVFVLTARMQEAAKPIHEWLKSQGINIPFGNITGLGNSKGEAKAEWMLEKFSEGYNDMYFVDDALPNVEAVKYVLDQLDIKSKVVQAKIQFSKDINLEFNKMLERTKGVAAEKRFSRVVGQKRGKNIGRYRFFVPPSAEDFAGLLYDFYGKGEQGDADMEFMKKALLDPFGRADREMSMARMSILDDYKMLRKQLPEVKKKLGKIIDKNTGFTFDNAVRVYLFDKAGFEVPGISQRDLDYLKNIINTDQDLKTFADTLGLISKREQGYIEPGENWSVETIASDLENIVNKIGRKQYLAEFIENKNIIFSPENMNKIEAVYGSRFRQALEDSLYRMENGTNRSKDRNYGQSWTNWVNGSVGAIMFFNGRSAVLQTLSTVNFINYQDNNIFAAGKALANQKQYWSDFATLFNSDFLRARRAGLQINVNEAELANAVAGAQNKAKAALAYLLKKGFLPTQIADSFAIASGGATFYRNRIKTYLKQGMDQKTAEEKAFLDFQEIAQETQQSSRPDRISQQQASPLGRLILAFANTPMQYNRLIKKAARDLINNRGDWRSNMSRILYYGAIQNVIFSAMQQAIFALSFDDEKDDELDKRTMRIANGMLDTILRGSGVTGAAVATIKNAIMRFVSEAERGSRADYGQVVVEAVQVSPPMGSKARKLYSALNAYKFNREIMGSMDTFDYNNPIWDAAAKVTTAATNVPLDRLFRKTDNIKEAFNQENSAMQRTFLLLGWSSWDLQVGERVVVNKGKKNEYVKYLDTKRQAQKEAKEELKEIKRKEKRAKQQRCTKIKSDGIRCKIMVNKPKSRCHYHD